MGHKNKARKHTVLAVLAFLVLAVAGWAGRPPDVVLLTLDTTRSDHVGAYGSSTAKTPVLDALARRGTRYARALAPSPLTLPSHASLLTGLEPPEHGLRDNGTVVLSADIPTLATVLAARGHATAAFVASRVLDRRFGLARGFDVYDDHMVAENIGQYGYPERDARAVTTAALRWLEDLPADKPFFLWVHYYDPHAPYQPPDAPRAGSARDAYAGEIAYMDREIGRLLAALSPRGDQGGKALPRRNAVVAAVGDHGEMLGEHGEDGHGIFLYRAALEVPLILAGPGIPSGQVVEEAVATRRLASTLLALVDAPALTERAGPALPGLGQAAAEPQPIYSEAQMPASAYGWAALRAVSDDRFRLIVAPRPELYDFVADPGEERDLLSTASAEARRLRASLLDLEKRFERHRPQEAPVDAELQAALESLGYAAGGNREGTIDPKDGIALLTEFERAKVLAQRDPRQAASILEGLVARNPQNVPFLSRLAAVQVALRRPEDAIATARRAVELNPRLDFLHRNLADAYLQLGRIDEARQEYELTLELNPRSAPAWLGLAELAHRSGQAGDEVRLLRDAVAAGTASAGISSRLGQIETTAGRFDAAVEHLRTAAELAPGWAMPHLLLGELAEKRGLAASAVEHYREALARAPRTPSLHLRLARLLLAGGDTAAARRHWQEIVALAPDSPEGQEARRRLGNP